MPAQCPPPRPQSYDKAVALVFQGGGALGSYQAGVYEALSESEYLPDWVAGISIGAVNAAIIAGNAPEHRVDRLRRFWEEITGPTALWPSRGGEAHRRCSALAALLFGQPGFFAPYVLPKWFGTSSPTSYYATGALKSTLERLVDFDRINAREMRFSVGAVNVRTGWFAYFDNAEIAIRPKHVMASGALPPGFPAVEIDGEHYWDGGLVSNTPLQYVVEYVPRRSRLSCQVDLFHSRGAIPTNLEEVSEREKDIRYSSRTRCATRPRRGSSIISAASPRWTSHSSSIGHTNRKAPPRISSSAARRCAPAGRRDARTRGRASDARGPAVARADAAGSGRICHARHRAHPAAFRSRHRGCARHDPAGRGLALAAPRTALAGRRMRRPHRRWHRLAWLVLPALAAVLFAAAPS
ncbi:MAG TPA: patatin-like phospholipase family protein [Stellaceae bacterium]|nr:patatin-like phospholipase family protein [Stellaceae bacterium]